MLLVSLFKETWPTWLMKNSSFFIWVWLMRVSKYVPYLAFSVSI